MPEFAKALGENLSGHSVRYPATPGDHPLTGTRLTSAPLTTTNPFDRLVPARPVLITSPGTTTKPTMDVDKHEFSFATADEIAAVLVRPDGHVAGSAPRTKTWPTKPPRPCGSCWHEHRAH